ncbi:MAG TPA: hypothetical protein VF604_14235 [Pyrinomonadaceae bacterium]|jgi:hypothetical protein
MKRFCPRFLILILPLLVCFHTATAQQNQPALVSFVSPAGVNYDIVKYHADKTRIELNLDNEGKVVFIKLLEGNAILYVKIKNDLAKWKFAESSESQRSVVLETDYSDKKMIISPYRVEVKIVIPEVMSLIPQNWEEGSHSCEVHREVLIKDKIRINYGSAVFLYDFAAYQSVEPKLFPHANSRYGGGCIVEEDSPKYVETLYCHKCRAAESAWLKENVKENQK